MDAGEPAMSLGFGHKPEIGVRLLVLVLILAAVALSVVGRCPELAMVTPLVRLAIPGDTGRSVTRRNASPATCPRSASLWLVLVAVLLIVLVSGSAPSGRRAAALSASVVTLRTATPVVSAILAGLRAIAGVMTSFSAVETLDRALMTVLRTF
jgi:hypothetical protein